MTTSTATNRTDALRREVRDKLTADQIERWRVVYRRPVGYWTYAQCEKALADLDPRGAVYPEAEAAPEDVQPEPACEPEPQPAPRPEVRPAAEPSNGVDLNAVFHRLIASVAASSVNEDRVRELIRETTEKNNDVVAEWVGGQVQAAVEEAVKNLKPQRFEVQAPDGVVREVQGQAHAQLGRVLLLANAKRQNGHRFNVLIVGPTGSGKSVLGEQAAKALGLAYGHLNLSEGISESHLAGRFVPTGEGGRFEYVPSEFARMYETGGVFVLEELDGADPNVLLAINQALSNGHMATPNPAKPVIERHPDFVCLACANTWGNGADREYVGRNQLDGATLERFRASRVFVDYDADLEQQIGRPELVAWAHAVRARIRETGMRRVMSTRWISDMTALIDQGVNDVESAKADYLQDWSADEKSKLRDLAA